MEKIFLVQIYKNTGDDNVFIIIEGSSWWVIPCNFKIFVTERFREETIVSENQLDFMFNRSIIDAIYLIRYPM